MLTGWRVYLAIGALAALVSGVLWAGGTVLHWRSLAARLPAVEHERDDARAETAQIRQQAEHERVRADTAVRGYVDEVESLRRRQRAAGQPVRLCVQPATSVPAASGPAVRPDAAAPAAGELPGSAGVGPVAGPDIGPELRQLADDADAVVAQCRGLQRWVADR